MAGSTLSTDGNVTGKVQPGFDWWIVKINSTGTIEWQRCFGGSANESASIVKQTSDGGYIVAGYTRSNDGDVTGNHGGTSYYGDLCLLKLSSGGNVEWKKLYGGSGDEWPAGILQMENGEYIVAATTESDDGDVSGNHLGGDIWMLKISALGDILWQNCFGGSGAERAYGLEATNDGGYIVTGSSDSNDGDVTGNHGSDDVWVVKFGDITGMKEQHPSAFRAYPSPSEGIFYLNTKGMSLHAVLTVQTCLGETVLQHSIDSETTRVDLSGYAAGIYFFAINDEKQKWTGKLVKE